MATPEGPVPLLLGKVVIVTGGASGIGRATALAFAREGAKAMHPEVESTLLAAVPQGRWCEPEEIAEAVDFLCSSRSYHMTGHVTAIDGGFTAR